MQEQRTQPSLFVSQVSNRRRLCLNSLYNTASIPPWLVLFLQTKPPSDTPALQQQLTLIPQRHSVRFHDLQSNRRTNEYGTRRIRHHGRAKAKATTQTSINPQMGFQGLERYTAVNSQNRQQSPPPALFSEAAGQCTSLDLGGGKEWIPSEVRTLGTQSPLLPSPARTLLTYVPHRLIIHPHHSRTIH